MKKKTKQTKNKQKKNTYHIKNQGNPKQQKQKPEHSNLICPITTTRKTKQKNTEIQNQEKERPTQENKGFESKCKKTLQTCRKIVFSETITSKLLKQDLIEDIKNTNVHN